MFLELQVYEFLEVKPQDKVKCGTDYYLTSKLYPNLAIDGFEVDMSIFNSTTHTILNKGYSEENITTNFNVYDATLNSITYAYHHNPPETLDIFDFSVYGAVLNLVLLPPYIDPELASISTNNMRVLEATLSLVLLPTNTAPIEAISADSFSVNYAQYG